MRLPKIKSYGQLAAFGGISLMLLVLFGTIYGLRSYSRYGYLTKRNIRVLGIAARQVEASVAGTEEVLGKTYDEIKSLIPEKLDGSTCQQFQTDIERQIAFIVQERQKRIPEIAMDASVSCNRDSEVSPKQRSVSLSFNNSGFTMNLTTSDGKTPFIVTLSGTGSLSDYLRPFLVRGVFDLILVMDGNGNTVLQEGEGGFRLNKTRARNASTVESMEISGDSYRFFYHPLNSKYDLSKSNTSTETSGEHGPSRALFGLGGLIRSSTFRSEALALSPFWLVALFLSLLGLALCWPFLRLKLIGARERVRVIDVVHISLSVLIGGALLVLLFLSASSFHLSELLEREKLKDLAEEIGENFEREIGLALHTLNEANISFERQGASCWGLLDEVSKKGELFRYPIFDVIFWIDADGWQREKWTGQKYGLNLVPLGDREYFRAAKEYRLWPHSFQKVPGILNEKVHNELFAMEPIRSRTTGKLQLALSRRVSPLKVAPREGSPATAEIAAMTIPAISVIRPILPYGFGFAIVDEHGRTLFHSSPERNLEENFIEESDDDAELKAAIASRTGHGMTIQYWGRSNFAYIQPLKAYQSWSVITFQEKSILRAMHADLLWVSAALLIILDVLVLIICVVLGVIALPRNGLKWLWLNPGTNEQYWRMTIAFSLIAFETLRVILTHPSGVLLNASFSSALTGIGLGILILGENRVVHRRIRFVGFIGIVFWLNLINVRDSFLELVWQTLVLVLSVMIAVRRGKYLERLESRFSDTHKVALRHSFISARTAAILLFSIIPAIGFFKYAQEQQFSLILQQRQVDLFHRLQDRENRLKALDETKQNYFNQYVCWNRESLRETDHIHFHERQSFSNKTLCDVYTRNQFQISYSQVQAPEQNNQSLTLLGGLSKLFHVFLRNRKVDELSRLVQWREQIKSFFDSTRVSILTGNQSFFSSQLLPDSETTDQWWWETGPAITFHHRSPHYILGSEEFLSINSAPIQIDLSTHFLFWVVGALFVWGLSWTIRFTARKFFVFELKSFPLITLDDLAHMEIRENLFVLCPPHCNKRRILEASEKKGFRVVEVERKTADRVQTLDTIEWNINRVKIVILSQVEPEYLLSDDEDIPDEKRLTEDLQRRWASLLRRFRRLIVTQPGNRSLFNQAVDEHRDELVKNENDPKRIAEIEGLFRILRMECSAHEQLQEIGMEIMREKDFPFEKPEGVVLRIREAAECFFLAVWDALPNEEKLLLSQLALGSLVNPKCERILQRLMAKGLISKVPALSVMSRSFELFILDTARPEDIYHWEQVGSISVWKQVRPFIFISTIILAVFLLATQQQLLGSFTAIAAIFTSMIPLLLRLVDLLSPPPIKQTKA